MYGMAGQQTCVAIGYGEVSSRPQRTLIEYARSFQEVSHAFYL